MLFLITKKQKQKLLDQYYSSLINIFSISLMILLCILAVSLFPTYLLVRVDKKVLEDKIQPMQYQIDQYKSESIKNKTSDVNNDVSILSLDVQNKTLDIYRDIKSIYESIPNVKVTGISVDSLSKKISINAIIDNKNTANLLVDKLNESKYKGAELPYSIFSQGKNFTFNQNLNYE